jgi:hypothetical protein
VLGNQLADAAGEGGGGLAADQAEQILQGEQARAVPLTRLEEEALQDDRAEGSGDLVGRLAAAAVADAADVDITRKILFIGGLAGLDGVEEVFEGVASEEAGEQEEFLFGGVDGGRRRGLLLEGDEEVSEASDVTEERCEGSDLFIGQGDCRGGGLGGRVSHGGVLWGSWWSDNTRQDTH